MSWQYTPYTLPLVLTGVLLLLFSAYLWRLGRDERSFGPLLGSLLMLAGAEWVLAYTLQLSSTVPSQKVFWLQFAFVGVVLLPLIWFGYVLWYSGWERWLTPRVFGTLGAVALGFLVFLATNESHHLVYREFRFVTVNSIAVLRPSYGPAFGAYMLYAYGLLSATLGLLVRTFLHTRGVFRRQVAVLFVFALVPGVAGVVYVSGYNPLPAVNIAALSNVVTAFAGWVSLVRFKWMDVTPVARDTAFDAMSEIVLVLDSEHRLVDMNPSAGRVLDDLAESGIGAPVTEPLPELDPVLNASSSSGRPEVTIAAGDADRTFEIDFLEQRVDDDYGVIKLVGSISLVIFYTIATSGEFIGAGKILNAVFGYDFFMGVLIGGALVLVYTLVGGFIAVSYTDVLQGLVMVGAVVLLPVIGFAGIGSIAAGLTELQAASGASAGLWGGSAGLMGLVGFFTGTIGIGFEYPGQPRITVRYMSIDDYRNLRKASLIGMVWVTFATYGSLFLGWAGGAYLGGIESTDQVMPLLAQELLPGWLVGILMAGAIAGMMSTSDSKFLVATNAVSYNLYKCFVNGDASDRQILWVSRGVMAVIVVAAVAMARPSGVVFSVILGGWAGIGASFGPLLIASLYWRRLNQWGAYAGVVIGIGTVLTWLWFDVGVVYELVPGFVFSGIAIVVVSLLTDEPSDEVQETFEDPTGASGLRVDDSVEDGVPSDD
ncbi:MAG: histidine kinase N-terminal 7TM domain-containing protein [Halolamina sp.]